MKRKYPDGKGKTKITVTINNDISEQLEEYIKENNIYNKSSLIEDIIKKQIEIDKKKLE